MPSCGGDALFAAMFGGAGPTVIDLAYLDAGTGSIVYQWILAGMLGGAFAIRMMWGRIAGFFAGLRHVDERDA